MKADQGSFARQAPNVVGKAKVFFFCGPDEAGAHQAAQHLIAMLDNPGERVDLAGADLRRDPVLLGDAARSVSLFGDTRHIVARVQGDEAHDAVANLLASDVPPCPVLIIATSATDKSRTAKLLIDRPDALVAIFYPPDMKSMAANLRQLAGAAGVTLTSELAERIGRGAGLDIRLAQSEITKLALYLDASPQAPRSADAEALDAIGAPTEEDGFAPLVDAVLSGNVGRFPSELRRMDDLGLSPVGVLLAIERRVGLLAQLAGKLGASGNIQALIDSERAARRVFKNEERQVQTQLGIWRGARAGRLVERLVTLHQSLLANNQSAKLLLSQELTQIAQHAHTLRARTPVKAR